MAAIVKTPNFNKGNFFIIPDADNPYNPNIKKKIETNMVIAAGSKWCISAFLRISSPTPV